jgi:O-antigen/teichoic acid export membrane protein
VLLATPYLARLYGPAEFGALALLMTLSNVSTAAACMRYDMALPSAPDEDVHGLLAISVLVAAALGLAGLVAAMLLSGNRLAAERAAVLVDRPVLVGACIVAVGVHQATSAWLLRQGAYRGVAGMRLSQGAGFSVLAAVPGIGLLWGHVASYSAGLIGLWQAVRVPARKSAGSAEVAQRYRKFPLYSLPGALLDVVGYSVCIWVVAAFYGQRAAGEYSQVQRLIGAPLMLASISLGQILLRHTAELVHDLAELQRLVHRLLRVMAVAAVAALLVLAVVGKPLIGAVLGPRWKVEQETVVLLGAAVFARACISPLSTVLITLRRFGLALAWQAAYFCSASLLMPLVASRVGLSGYVRFYMVHELAFYGVYLLLILFAVRDLPCAQSSAS